MARQLDAGRRRARELEIAKAVQAKLLPQAAPVLTTLDYAGRCIQARSIGGDYFDFISVGEGRFAFVLADISGKGISAALLMASLQASLRAQYTVAPADVRAVLRTVNRVFYGSTATNHYATLFFGVYDETTRVLQYANCGHLPPILRRSTGRLDRLQPTATVIGLFDEWDCRTAETTLAPGDTLVVFSDGASEAVNAADEEFGEERLAAIVDGQSQAGAAALLDAIVAAVTEHGGTQQYDDLTLIVATWTLRRRAPLPRLRICLAPSRLGGCHQHRDGARPPPPAGRPPLVEPRAVSYSPSRHDCVIFVEEHTPS